MDDLPQLGEELLIALNRLTQAGTAIWLQGAGSPGHIYCYIGEERVDFVVYVDADVIGSPSGDVAAVSAVFRNIRTLFVQPEVTAPRLLELLRSATENGELFRRLQKKFLFRAASHLRGMA